MNILAMDTSTAWAGVALQFAGARYYATWRSAHNHGRELVPALTDLMEAAHCDVSALNCVAVALGPGGFSAVRVGVSCGLGIASPRGLTTVGIPTHYFQARARVAQLESADHGRGVPDSEKSIVEPAALTSAIPIGRNQFSIATFDLPLGSIDATSTSCICDKVELESIASDCCTIMVGGGVTQPGGDGDPEEHGSPRPPEVMLDIAIESVNHGIADFWPLRPIYAREPTITKPVTKSLG